MSKGTPLIDSRTNLATQITLKFYKKNKKFVPQGKSVLVCVGGQTVGNVGTEPKRGKHCGIRRGGGKVGSKSTLLFAAKPPDRGLWLIYNEATLKTAWLHVWWDRDSSTSLAA